MPEGEGVEGGTLEVEVSVDANSMAFGGSVAVPVSIRDLLAALPPEAQAVLGWIPDVELNAVGFRFDPNPATESFGVFASAGTAGSADTSVDVYLATLQAPGGGEPAFVVGLSLTSTIDLGGTPLFGTMLSGITLQALGLSYASADLPAGSFTLPPPAPRMPAFRKGLQLTFTVSAGGSAETFTLTPSSFRPPAAGAGRSLALAAAGPPPVQWFPVQKSFGPLTLGRVGILTAEGRFGLALDASVSTTVLQLVLEELSVAFDSDDISPSGLHLDLAGLGVGFQSGAFQLSGSLVRTYVDELTEYRGSLLIRAGRFAITAVGAYADLAGAPSLFVFGMAKGAFGGPPAFFVTGLAAGFGYNRSLRLPAPEQVQEFPLVLAARQGSSYLPDPSVGAALGKMTSGGWVPPSLGSYWVAAGVEFTSFQVLDAFVLVTVQFGKELVVALLGVASITLPKPGTGPAYAYAELALSAVLRPAEGTFQMTALLTPNSFVIDRACRLTGGFAFHLWFGDNEHAGDFVVTLGGYNALFDRPDWYPVVPRLGLNWNMSDAVHVQGGVYFALTPSCVMGGGSLDLRFQRGALRAWLTAHADFIMYWRPFFFDVGIGVSVGVSYTLDIGGISKTFTVELSADVELWGPPTAGVAHVTWWVISFTIPINGGGSPQPPGRVLRDWPTFASTFLPPAPEVCRPRAASGLLGTVEIAGRTVWRVSAAAFALGTETVVPATRVVAGTAAAGEQAFDGPAVGVYPMAVADMRTEHRVTLFRVEGGAPYPIDDWTWLPSTGNVPGSLWGTANAGEPALGADVVPCLHGLVGAPPDQPMDGPPEVSFDVLRYADLAPTRDLPLPTGPPVDGSTTPPAVDPRRVVADTVAAPEVVACRAAVVGALTAAGAARQVVPGDLSLLRDEVEATFPAPPMLGPPGTTGPRHPATGTASAARTGRRPRRPAARPSRPDVAVLRAVFRRHPAPAAAVGATARYGWLRPSRARVGAHVAESRAGRHERVAAAGPVGDGGRVATVRAGTTLVWDLPGGLPVTVRADGGAPVRLAAFDERFRLVDDAVVPAGGARQLPPGAVQLAVVGGATDGAPAGWHGGGRLVQVNPAALLGDGALVRPQVPNRVTRRRATRPLGVTTGWAAVDRNWTDGPGGPLRGWVVTAVPGPVGAVAVLVRRDDGGVPGGDAADGVEVSLLGGAEALAPVETVVDGTLAAVVFEHPGAGGDVVVRPAPGWHQYGLVAFEAGPAGVLAGEPGAGPEAAAPDGGVTEVTVGA